MCVGRTVIHCRIFSCIPVLYPVDCCSTPPHRCTYTSYHNKKFLKTLPNVSWRGAKSSPVENHCFRTDCCHLAHGLRVLRKDLEYSAARCPGDLRAMLEHLLTDLSYPPVRARSLPTVSPQRPIDFTVQSFSL